MERPVGPGGPDVSASVDKLIADINSQLELRNHVDAQVVVVARLAALLPGLPTEARKRALDALARSLDRVPIWIERVTRLPEPEVYRALSSKPVFAQRRDEEVLYPTDGWLGAYLLYTQESEAPLGWHFWCGAALLSVVARRNFYWDRGIYYLFLNQYVLLLGESGLTKSTTINRVASVFDEMTELAKACQVIGLDPIYRSPERITAPRLLQDLSKWTKTFSAGRKDTVIFVVSDELATLLGRDVKGSDQLTNLLTDIYMGKKSHRDATIIGGDRSLTNVVATCLFATTADSARRNITENMFSEGFMGRVIVVARSQPHGNYSTPPAADPVMRQTLVEQLAPWLMIDQPVRLQRGKEAEDWFETWYQGHKTRQPQDPKLAAFWNRKADHMLRLAGILKLSQLIGGPPETVDQVRGDRVVLIERELLELALAILEDEERRLPSALSNIGAKEEARELWRVEAHIRKWCQEHQEWYPHHMLYRNVVYIAGNRIRFSDILMSLQDQRLIDVFSMVIGGKTAAFYKPCDLNVPKPKLGGEK